MSKTIITTTALLFTTLLAFSQDFRKQFRDFSAKDDTSGQAKVLAAWEKATPKDPELFIAYFNFYVKKSSAEIVSLDQTKNTQNSFVITDTTSGKPVAFLNSSLNYKSDILQKGFEYMDHGIELYPSRLDMRFGKIYMLGEAENYPEFVKEIVLTIDYSTKINNNWLWKEGKPLENPKKFFLGTPQVYVKTIYNTEDDKLLPLIRQISEAVIKYYPDHVESLANIALTYLLTEEYDKALPFLLKAEKIAPKDIVVLNNIAETYKQKGDKANARIYYEKIIQNGSKEESQRAKAQLQTL